MGGTQLKENGTMNWLAQIRQMKNRDIRTIEQSELQELQQDAVEHGLRQWNYCKAEFCTKRVQHTV